ncbi:glycoside hydrolase family 5 protein [Tylopilus felleus]
MASYLTVLGTKIIDGDGNEVILRGAGFGGWMNMENFISGYPGCEFQIRAALMEVIGPVVKSAFFFDKFLEYFFQEEDAKFFKSLGLNCIRLPFNYRHFEDDMNPRVLKQEGSTSTASLTYVHNMASTPSSTSTPHPEDRTRIGTPMQDRAIWLWTELAKYYVGNKWIAGYNPLNEPTDPSHTTVVKFYERVYDAIRTVDTEHIIFFDGNTFASDFSHFGDVHQKWANTAYSIHDYSVFGFPASPEKYVSSDEQRRRLRRSYEKKREWMDQHGLCVWNGEWGPVYVRKQYDGAATDAINEQRYRVLKDQLAIYNQDRLSWSIWLYKDIGFQGMVYVSQETKYMTLLKGFLTKKHRLAVDAWGADTTWVQHVYQPLIDHIAKEIPLEYQALYPAPVWKMPDRVGRLSRCILVAEYLVKEWAEHFRGKSEAELDEIAQSFKFENCLRRDGLNKILTANAALAAGK